MLILPGFIGEVNRSIQFPSNPLASREGSRSKGKTGNTRKEYFMIGTVSKVQYPYITSAPDIAGGALIIEGTRITVRCIASYYQMGMTVDELLMTLPTLRPSQVHSALA